MVWLQVNYILTDFMPPWLLRGSEIVSYNSGFVYFSLQFSQCLPRVFWSSLIILHIHWYVFLENWSIHHSIRTFFIPDNVFLLLFISFSIPLQLICIFILEVSFLETHIVVCLFFSIHSDNLYLLLGIFRPFTFKVIIDVVCLIFMFLSSLCVQLFVFFSWFSAFSGFNGAFYLVSLFSSLSIIIMLILPVFF